MTLEHQSAPSAEFLKSWKSSGRQQLEAQIAPDSINDGERTVDCIFYTGVDVERYNWTDGAYMMRLDPKGADLSLLNNGAPVLDCHWMCSAGDQKGVVARAWVDGTDYKATLRFKRSTEATGPRPELDGLWQDIKDKIVTKFSMGLNVVESVEQRDKDGKLTLKTATEWQPFEISIAPIPADFGTTTLAAEAPAHSLLACASSSRTREAEILRLR